MSTILFVVFDIEHSMCAVDFYIFKKSYPNIESDFHKIYIFGIVKMRTFGICCYLFKITYFCYALICIDIDRFD